MRLLRPSSFHHRPTPSLAGPWPREGSGLRGVLDLDHLGAEVAEHGGGERPGEEGGEVEDAEAVEGRCGHRDARDRLVAGGVVRGGVVHGSVRLSWSWSVAAKASISERCGMDA